MVNDNDNPEERTAFYKATASQQFSGKFPYDKVYDDVFKAILPHLREGMSSRYISMAMLTVLWDLYTCTIGMMDYADKETNPEGLDPAKDLEHLMGSFINMMNVAEQAIMVNMRLLKDKKSIFNTNLGLDS